MISAHLQLPGVFGDSADTAHAGWLELVRLEVKPAPTRRHAPVASVVPASPPILVYGWSILGQHSRGLRAMWALGNEFAWGVLEVARSVKGKPLLQHRIRMSAVHVMSYEPFRDPGLVKPIAQFVLVPTTYTSEVGSALRLTLLHERLHASGAPPRAGGGPLQRPVTNNRTSPSGHG